MAHGIPRECAGSEYSLMARAAFNGPDMLSPVNTARFGVSPVKTRSMKTVEFRSVQGLYYIKIIIIIIIIIIIVIVIKRERR
jgi:hypothetical protein